MKNYAIGIGALVLAAAGVLWVAQVREARVPGGGQACTTEAKICPDGSAVGRTGPNCEFAPCPAAKGPISLDARVGQEVNGLDVRIVPIEVLEDSRCPIDVQCIQAGTVRLRARLISGLGEANQEFKLGQPITTEAEIVTLVEVLPQPKAGVQIKRDDYVFRFEIAKRAGDTRLSDSGVYGTVLLGPTCPVVQDPPDPQCADRPYATAIAVYRTDSSTPFLVGNSNANGTFKFSLPPGVYTLKAMGETTLPRCNPGDVTVVSGAYASLAISCDTGIR